MPKLRICVDDLAVESFATIKHRFGAAVDITGNHPTCYSREPYQCPTGDSDCHACAN
jgi:hypothetical protein